MEEVDVVTCFLRSRAEVLLLCRSEAVGSYTGRWGAVAGHVEPEHADDAERDPEAAARSEIAEETGLKDAVAPVRAGDPFPVEDADRGTRWIVHPFLFDCDSRTVEPNYETVAHEWAPPTEILRRPTVPRLWTSYDRVRPTAETVAADREHGSAYLSLRALEALRDEAALAVEDGDEWERLADTARALRGARPGMTAVRNRIDRTMHAAAGRTAAAVERAAERTIGAALAADGDAAQVAADRVAGGRVVTLSRSGTVRETLRRADPEAVLVAESRPGAEGVEVAEDLAATTDVTLAPDAAIAHLLGTGEWDAVVVGADTVLPDGSVLNKVGTRAVALAADCEDVPCYAVAATDKISPADDHSLGTADPDEVYDGDADLGVAAPLFDVTPPDLIEGVVTERGTIDPGDVGAIAAEHRERAGWLS